MIPNIDAITMATIVHVDIKSVGRPSTMVPVSVFTSPKSWSVRDCGVPDVRVTCRVDGMTEPLVSVLRREEVTYPDSSLSKPIKGNFFFFHLSNLNYVIVIYGEGRGGSMICYEFELCHSDLWGEDCMFYFEFELCHNYS